MSFHGVTGVPATNAELSKLTDQQISDLLSSNVPSKAQRTRLINEQMRRAHVQP